MTGSAGLPPSQFPGGTAVSHLAVYDWSTPDGLQGGSAHVHLACTEGYVVLGGAGRLQTLSSAGFAETQLTPMTVLWFSPGVVHRLINDGDLRILVVMQNGGLPEAGDSVLTFPPEYLGEDSTYRAIAAPRPYADITPEAAAHRRQQLAVQGFLRLREQVERDGQVALDAFYDAAAALVRDRVPAWRKLWADGALAAAQRTGDHLDLLSTGHREHLSDGRLSVVAPPSTSFGMCGHLHSYPPTSGTAASDT